MPKKPEYYNPKGKARQKPSGWSRWRFRQNEAALSRQERGYGATWDRLRLMVLAREPLCRSCMAEGRTTPAEEVDHIIPLRQGGTNADGNLQALCRACHARKTATEGRVLGGGYPQ